MGLWQMGNPQKFKFSNPFASVHQLREWVQNRPVKHPSACVVCGEPASTQFTNQNSNQLDFVHDYYEPDYLGCKEVWRYWQERDRKMTRASYQEALYQEYGEYWRSYFDERGADLLDERDSYHDRQSYMASREWQIKADALKRAASSRCEDCGRPGNRSTLDVHHKHYDTLYKERRKDLEVLCRECHSGRHGR